MPLLYHLLVALGPVIFLYETKLISKEISRRLFVAEVTHYDADRPDIKLSVQVLSW